MAVISEAYLARLRDRGLLISEPFDSNADFFPDGVIVSKPASVIGNNLPGCKTLWDSTDPSTVLLDAPLLWFHSDKSKWFVTILHEQPGPGNVFHEWATPEAAIADILDFYFGDPSRMHRFAGKG